MPHTLVEDHHSLYLGDVKSLCPVRSNTLQMAQSMQQISQQFPIYAYINKAAVCNMYDLYFV
jgi:hypothetical protein